jgi:hypothetical protein
LGKGSDSSSNSASDDSVNVNRGRGSGSRGLTKGNLELTHLYTSAASLIISSSYYRQELKILVLYSCYLHNLSSCLSSVLDVLIGILDVLRGSS